MSLKTTKQLLLSSAISIVLLPGLAPASAFAYTPNRMSAVSDSSFPPESTRLKLSKAMRLSDVRNLYVMPFTPDSGGFRSNIIEGLRNGSRFRLVSSQEQADAVVEGAARSTGYGFWGTISVRSAADNRLLWSASASRRDGTRDRMAFNQLVSRLNIAASQL